MQTNLNQLNLALLQKYFGSSTNQNVHFNTVIPAYIDTVRTMFNKQSKLNHWLENGASVKRVLIKYANVCSHISRREM